jgi:hypothetical protein
MMSFIDDVRFFPHGWMVPNNIPYVFSDFNRLAGIWSLILPASIEHCLSGIQLN